MASSLPFSNAVDTTTEDFLVPQVVDNVLRSNQLTKDILKNSGKFSSATELFPVKYQVGTSATSFIGYDALPTAQSTTRVNMIYQPRFSTVNVSLALTDIITNNTQNQVLKLAEIEMATRGQDLADAVGTMFYSTGTGNSNKDFLGLEALVDDGTNTSTIGNLSRTSYNNVFNSTVTASSGTLSLAKLSTLYMAISDDSVIPTDIYGSPTIYSLYESLLQPMQRLDTGTKVTDAGMSAEAGFVRLGYKGIGYKVDRKATSGVLYMLNMDYLKFLAVEANGSMDYKPAKYQNAEVVGNDYSKAKGLGFGWSGWIKATNAAAYNGFIILAGNFICTAPLRQGKLTGITSS